MKKKNHAVYELLLSLLLLVCICSCSTNDTSPKMIKIKNEDLNIQISETLVTMKDFKEYIVANNIESIEEFESRKIRSRDIYYELDFNDDWPLWDITWREAADYCNWLSKKDGYNPCYIFSEENKKALSCKVTIDKDANGFRMPYIRELIILSGIKDGLTKEKYEKENLCNIEQDINKMIARPVFEGNKNDYGVYDILGNLEQYCNDFYLEDYDYFDYNLSQFGPESYTPDPIQVGYNETLTPVRCCFGGFWFDTYESIQKKIIFDVNERSKEFSGIRLVRQTKR